MMMRLAVLAWFRINSQHSNLLRQKRREGNDELLFKNERRSCDDAKDLLAISSVIRSCVESHDNSYDDANKEAVD
jgi:hypothetical protein